MLKIIFNEFFFLQFVIESIHSFGRKKTLWNLKLVENKCKVLIII